MAVTVTVFTGSVTDPVNVTKLFVLGGFSFAALGSMLHRRSIITLKNFKLPITVILLFMMASLFTLVMSKAPLSQSFYGVYGRNNGFLLYFLLVILFIATLSVSKAEYLKVILNGLFLAGAVNLVYAYWVITFGDFIPWNNIYGNLLGTLGNPNFIGSFFGIFSGLLFALLFASNTKIKMRIIFALMLTATFYGIVETKAVQGKVLFIAAAGIVLFYKIRTTFQSIIAPITYLAASLVAFIFAVLGTQQIGPLTRLLYKETVTLRGEYWYAGWQTGISNPVAGAGFDAYGDWYRRSRSESALKFPGVDTITNAAHNVYLDLFAFGGWPLFLSYMGLSLLVVFAIVRVTCRKKEFDVVFVAMVAVWTCYQLQSVISINQIGLAIWGWVSAAALLGYEYHDRQRKNPATIPSNPVSKLKSIKPSSGIVTPGLKAGSLSVLGMLLAVPPLSADMKWNSAQLSRDVNRLIATLDPSYMNPLSSFKINSVVGVLEINNFPEQAHEQALRAVAIYPDSFEAWRNITLLSKSTEREKLMARENMKRLDPLNQTIYMETE